MAGAVFPGKQGLLKIAVAFGDVFANGGPFIASFLRPGADITAVAAFVGKKIVLFHVYGMSDGGFFESGIPSKWANGWHILAATLATLGSEVVDLPEHFLFSAVVESGGCGGLVEWPNCGANKSGGDGDF